MEYLSPQGVLLPLVYGTTASPLWLELRGRSAWQATPSWTVYRLACHRLHPWLRVTFAMVPDAAWPGSDQQPWSTAPATGPVGRLGRPSVSDPWGVGSFLSPDRPTCVRCPGPPGSCSPVCPLGVLCRVCGVLGLPAPVHRCARSVWCVACAVSWASRLLFTGAPARCVVLRVRCPGPPGSCSPVCPLGVLCCVCGVLGLPAPVHRCARSVCCVACAGSWASRLLFTGAPARCVVLRVRCPGLPGFCSPVCPLGVLSCVCGVLGLLAPVHRCARSVCSVACAVSWASWLLFTGVPARCVVLRVRCPGPPGSCSPVCPLVVLCCVCGVLGLLAPVHRCARSVCCVACAVSWASWLLFTGVPARCVVLRVRRPGPPGSCSPVCPLDVLRYVCGVLGLLAPVHRCARSVCCVACAVSWASWLLFTGVPARCVALRVRCPGPPGSCSTVCPLGVLRCVCGVLGLPAPVHRCARSVCCFACAVSWASRLLFTCVPAGCVVLRLRCPGPPGSCSPVRPLAVLCCVCGVLGLPAPVHRCARSVCCVGCEVSWVSWLLFTGVPARCVTLRVRCPGPPGSCSPVRPLGVLCCVCGVLGLPASVHRCARSVCCVGCAVSWASWLLFTGVPARCVVLRVRRPGPPGSCSPVCPFGVLCCVCGVLGLLAPVHRCARSVCCVACAASWASWLLFTGVPARCVVLRVRCPGPPGSCSPVCPLGVLCCVCGVLGLPAPVHRCARSVCCFACAVSWASRLLFTGVPARCVFFFFFFFFFFFCVCGVLGLPAPVHRCARSVCCVACAASWASWLLFTGVPARCVVLRLRCPRPPGSCSPVCPLGVLCCVCGVLGLLAPVHRCARSVCCVACAVSWASRLLFTGVPARCVVLRMRRPGPPGSCSPVCPLGVLCCVCGVLGLPAPVHRCARSVCCVAVRGVAAGRSHVHPDGGWRSRQGVGTLRAHTRPSGRRLFVAGRGWVPSGRALVHPDGGWRACACSLWPGRAGRPPGRVVVRLTFSFGRFVFLLCSAPSGLGLPPSLLLPLPFLVALALCFGCFSRPPAAWLFVRSRLVCVSRLAVGCSLVVSPPPPLFVSRGFWRSCLVPWWCFFFFFFFPFFPCAPPLSPAFSGFRPRVPWASALCVVCFVGLPPLGSPCACPSFVLSAWLVVAPRRLLPPPPPLFVSRFSSLPLGAVVCCVVLCVPGCGAAPRCCALCPPVLCCPVLCCARWVPLLVAPCPLALPVALGPCALRRCVLRCSPVLCVFCRGAVVRAVVRRSALCCVCPGVLCCAFPVLSALCGAVLRCAGALALCCSCGACCCWCLVLWCAVVRCWVWWPVVVCWWRVSVSVCLSGRVVCCPVVGVVWCGALLSCVVFCGAVLSRGAVLLCSAVVLRCCWGLLCPPVGCRAVLCCALGWLCCFLPGGGVCMLWCSFPCAVRSLSSPLCALRCLLVLAVVPRFPVSCAVALCCRVVLCCRALLSFCGAACVCFALLRPVVRRQCRLRCCWCLVLWRVPVRCGVSLGVLRCGGAALVCRGVLLCCALSCGVLRPVPCPAVPCCTAVLCWLAVLCGCLRCWCLFFLLSSFPLRGCGCNYLKNRCKIS